MELSRATLLVTVCVVVVVGLSAAPAMAMHIAPQNGGGEPVVQCEDHIWYNVAVIEFDEVPNEHLENNAMYYAEIAIEKCNLEGRLQREVAGEIVAHIVGKNAPFGINGGPTIDIAGSGHDPQEDKYYYTGDQWWSGII